MKRSEHYSNKQEIVHIRDDYRIIHLLPDGDKEVHPNFAPYTVVKGNTHIDDAGSEGDAREIIDRIYRRATNDIIKKRWRNKVAKGLVCPNCSRIHPVGTEDQHPGLAFRCGGCGLKFIVTNPAVLD